MEIGKIILRNFVNATLALSDLSEINGVPERIHENSRPHGKSQARNCSRTSMSLDAPGLSLVVHAAKVRTKGTQPFLPLDQPSLRPSSSPCRNPGDSMFAHSVRSTASTLDPGLP
jgi:hypothetical protein